MKAVLVNKSVNKGGAAVVTARLTDALRQGGVDARLLTADMEGLRMSARWPFLQERLGVYLRNGLNRERLFRADPGTRGLPLWKHPWVKEADVICLNWVNQGTLSLEGVERLRALGKPIVWTMHDMWNMTGVCHHAGLCDGWLRDECRRCPQLRPGAKSTPLSHRTWERKAELYRGGGIQFVAVSHWLAEKAKESPLMRDVPLKVIPNAFTLPMSDDETGGRQPGRIVFGAARLDDPIKGLPVLKEALRLIVKEDPHLASSLELVTFGGVKDPTSLEGIAIRHHHAGVLDMDAVRRVYESGRVVVSSSQYETLPGTLVEGQAWGCIPVAFDSGGQRDIVTHGMTGYLCRPDSAESLKEGILWALQESLGPKGVAIRARMRENVMERFSSDAVAEQYIHLFEELLKNQNNTKI